MIIYSNNFSTDPSWSTDQSENFYWDSATGTFVANTENLVPDYSPNRYAFEDINLDVSQSFTISWEYIILGAEGYGISHFGLFDDNLLTGGSEVSTLNAGHGVWTDTLGPTQNYDLNIDTTAFQTQGQGGTSGNDRGGEIGSWYSVTLTYNAELSQVTYELFNLSSDTVAIDLTRDISGVFLEDMTNIGIAHDPFGLGSSVYALDPTDYQITAYDNIVVIGEPLLETDDPGKTLVFIDNFERSDDVDLGNGWVERFETPAGTEGFSGESVLSLQNGEMVFDYDRLGNTITGSPFLGPLASNDISTDVAGGFEISFEVTLGDNARMFHFVGLADSSAGLVGEPTAPNQSGAVPAAGIGLLLGRTDSTFSNSSVRLFEFRGDEIGQAQTDPNQVLLSERTSFQFEPLSTVTATLRVDVDGAYLIEVSNGTTTDTFTGTIAPEYLSLDQVVVSSIGSTPSFGDQNETISIDNISVYSLDKNVEPTDFDFNVFTAMQLATAAYAPIEDAPEAPDTGDRLTETSVYLSLFDDSTTLRAVDGFSNLDGKAITDSNGFYINENAAALVAVTDDALVISFRGTNDNDDTYRNVSEAIFPTDITGSQATGLAGLQGLSKANGKGRGIEKAQENAIDRAIPDNIQSPDVEDWFDLEGHWELFSELWASIPQLLEEYGVSNIYLTGHSLGGSMVQWAMSSAEGAVDSSIKDAYTYGAPGLENWRTGAADETRLLNIGFENDWVFNANYVTSRIGDQLTIDTDGTGEHDTASYLEAAQILLEAGFVTGDRLDEPGKPGTEFGPQMERIALSLEGDGLTILKDSLQDGVFGTSGNDDITVSMDLFRNGGFVVIGREGNDTIDLSSGEDVFVFREGDGEDTVEDFNLAEDLVVLYGFIASVDPQLIEVSGNLPFTSDTTVNFGNGDSITFRGLDIDDVELLLENNVIPTDAFDPLIVA